MPSPLTASIAVGSEVRVSNVYQGAAAMCQGGATQARIAVYKACWHNLCGGADVLKAFDYSIYNDVVVITISAGSEKPEFYFDNCFAIEALHAFRAGILVSTAAGISQ